MVGTTGKKREIAELSLVAYLQMRGHRFVASLVAAKRVVFIFDSTEKLETDVLRFLNRSAKVDALSYSEAMKGIKRLAFSVMETNPIQERR